MTESDRLFIDLRPPSGGLQRLQRTLAHPAHRTRPWGWRLAAGAVALSILVQAWQVPGVIARQQQTATLTAAARTALAAPTSGIRIVDGAAIELPSGQPNVRLYLVQTAAVAGRRH